MMFMDENVDEKWEWMNFFMNVGKKKLGEKLNKKNKMEKIYVGLFWKIQHMKC